MVRIALEMVPTLVSMLSSANPWHCWATERQYNRAITFLLGKQVTRTWFWKFSVVWIDEDHLFNGFKGDLRPGLRGNMGHIIGLKPKAQMSLDIVGPYNSPPWFVIRDRLLGTNQGIQGTTITREVQQVDNGRSRNSLMCPQKARCIRLFFQPLSLSDGSWTEVARVAVNGDSLVSSPPNY